MHVFKGKQFRIQSDQWQSCAWACRHNYWNQVQVRCDWVHLVISWCRSGTRPYLAFLLQFKGQLCSDESGTEDGLGMGYYYTFVTFTLTQLAKLWICLGRNPSLLPKWAQQWKWSGGGGREARERKDRGRWEGEQGSKGYNIVHD